MALLCLAGCQQQPATTKPADGDAAADVPVTNDAATQRGNGPRGLRIRPDVDTFPGRWGLVATQPMADENQQVQYREICMALFEFTEASDDSLKATVLATPNDSVKLEVERVAVDGKQIELDLSGDFDGNPGRMEFRGTLAGGLVRGTVAEPGTPPIAAYLKPTEETTFEGWDYSPPAPGMDIILHAMQQKNQPAAMIAAAKELHGNPLALVVYQELLMRLSRLPQLQEAQLRGIVADYTTSAAVWGPRKETEARLNAAAAVTQSRRAPAFVMELVQQIEDSKAEGLESWTELLQTIRDQTEVDLALGQLRSTDEAQQATGFAALQDRLPKQRYNAEILNVLAEHSLKIGQHDQAQEYFADIVALPLLEAMWQQARAGQPPGDPTPRERLAKLWEDKHGNTNGLDAYLIQTYQERMAELLEQTRTAGPEPTPADAGNHIVLVELFTGVGCPPCVAGDLALSALRDTYPISEVVVLQFHQHIPLPDPLCNQDSEERFSYYSAQGTPAVFVDGAPVPAGVGGFLQHVKQSYSAMRPAVDERVKVTSEVSIEAVAAAANGELSVDASVDGLAEDQLPQVRLRMALAEHDVALAAPNGLRTHELVVREMLGGAKGVGAKSGKLAFSFRLPLAEFKQHLIDYLTQFEAGRDVNFAAKPLRLKPLSLVVWVQNDQTREVLQTTIVPVTGELVYPEEESETDPASAATPANTPPQ